MFDVMKEKEPREDAKGQVMWSKGHVRKVISQWQAKLCRGTGEATGDRLYGHGLQGIPGIKCVREKRWKTERLERGQSKKRGKDPENGEEKEDIGQKLKLRGIWIP